MEDGRIGSWEGEGAWNSELGMRNGEEGKDKATDSHRRTRTEGIDVKRGVIMGIGTPILMAKKWF